MAKFESDQTFLKKFGLMPAIYWKWSYLEIPTILNFIGHIRSFTTSRIIKIAILTFEGHLRSRSPMRRTYTISYTCLMQLEAPTAIIWAPNMNIAILTFKGYLRTSSRSPTRRPYMISYTCLIQLEALSATI